MRIGIVPALNPAHGGVYQYSITTLRALSEWSDKTCRDEFIVFADQVAHSALRPLNGRGWTFKPLVPEQSTSIRKEMKKIVDVLRETVGDGPHREAWRWLRRQLPRPIKHHNPDILRSRPEVRLWFEHCGVDLMFYPWPQSVSFESGIPYIMAIHDLQHRLQPEFPEVSANGEREYREYLFRNGARHATLLIADSEVGKEDILNFYGPYGVTPECVKVLPFLPASYLALDVSESERQRVRTTYHLPERYLFYPAQFWPHKNHARLVQALGLLNEQYQMKVPVVFCGSWSGEIRQRTFNELMSLCSKLRLETQIHCLGYVGNEDMSALYSEAQALVMPTFFGPTNIPVLEAWACACPVLTSDIRGIREQVADAAVLANPRSVESIADGVCRLWTDDSLRRTLIEAGRRRLASYTPDDYRNRLIEILQEAKDRVRSKGIIVAGNGINPHVIEKLVWHILPFTTAALLA
jgi:glycosyltransferase involved in cell wall biosynthesis